MHTIGSSSLENLKVQVLGYRLKVCTEPVSLLDAQSVLELDTTIEKFLPMESEKVLCTPTNLKQVAKTTRLS